MTEKKDFKVSRQVTVDEMELLINSKYASIKLNDLKANEQFIAKIEGDMIIQEKEVTDPDDGEKSMKKFCSIPVIYDVEGSDYHMDVRVSVRCAERFIEKYKELDTIGKNAFFSKTMFKDEAGEKRYPQFINVIMKEYQLKNEFSFKDLKQSKTKTMGIDPQERDFIAHMRTKKEVTKESFIKEYVSNGGIEERGVELFNQM